MMAERVGFALAIEEILDTLEHLAMPDPAEATLARQQRTGSRGKGPSAGR